MSKYKKKPVPSLQAAGKDNEDVTDLKLDLNGSNGSDDGFEEFMLDNSPKKKKKKRHRREKERGGSDAADKPSLKSATSPEKAFNLGTDDDDNNGTNNDDDGDDTHFFSSKNKSRVGGKSNSLGNTIKGKLTNSVTGVVKSYGDVHDIYSSTNQASGNGDNDPSDSMMTPVQERPSRKFRLSGSTFNSDVPSELDESIGESFENDNANKSPAVGTLSAKKEVSFLLELRKPDRGFSCGLACIVGFPKI